MLVQQLLPQAHPGNVDTTTVGSYTITYTATDLASGNTATATRTVTCC